MKKYHNIQLMPLLCLAVALFASCREDFDYDKAYGGKLYAEKCAKYDDAFKAEFCNGASIDPTHNWGFTELPTLEELQTKASTRGANPNSNQWADTYNVPADIKTKESKAVYEYIKDHSTEKSIDISYSDFFVQHVWQGTVVYKDGNKNDVYAKDKMNQLMAGTPSVKDHVNNFNNCYGTIMLMQNSGTTYFAYSNSQDGKQHDEKNTDYKIFNVPGYGYYVGFDFCATGGNKDQKVKADGFFTDWIVKIVPATLKGSGNEGGSGNDQPDEDFKAQATRRVMCEDLGGYTGNDIDFNDVVFDVTYLTATRAKITIQAAGGTMPIYIGSETPENEVHALFGVSHKTMVNTNREGYLNKNVAGVKTCEPVSIEIAVQSQDPNDIPVTVQAADGTTYSLSSNTGWPTQKICVPAETGWTNERVGIAEQYPRFSDWVSDSNIKFWEEEAGDNNVVNSGSVIWFKGIQFSGWSKTFIDRSETNLTALAAGKKLRFNCSMKVSGWQSPTFRVFIGEWGTQQIYEYAGNQAGANGYEEDKSFDVTLTKEMVSTLETSGSNVFTIDGKYFWLNSIEIID